MLTTGKTFAPKGIYIHTPFCKRKCPYCHFYVVKSDSIWEERLIRAIEREWVSLLPQALPAKSLYIGGGTPTQLSLTSLSRLLSLVPSAEEITVEVNPEDMTFELASFLCAHGVNRVSIGVQSLQEDSLLTLGRGHGRGRAIEAIETVYAAGIENISIDLMYDLPSQSVSSFESTLKALSSLPISHLSLYNLTIEPKTSFFAKRNTLRLPSDEESLEMLNLAISYLTSMGLYRYEISAFAKPGREAVHNSGYWEGRPFFGLGPSAFSDINGERYQNIPNIKVYCERVEQDLSPIEFRETLPYPKNLRERLAVHLRLLRGVPLAPFPPSLLADIASLTEQGYLDQTSDTLSLTEKGILFYDTVATALI